MKIINNILIISFCFILLLAYSKPANAILGNNPDENEIIYGKPDSKPKYHYLGSKDITIYKKDNATITVVYRNNKSILENISYILAEEDNNANNDIKKYILPSGNEKYKFKSSMPFAEAYYEEYIYNDGVKIKKIFNVDNKITEVISSVLVSDNLTQTHE